MNSKVIRRSLPNVQRRTSIGIKRINKNAANVLKEIYKYQHSSEYLFRRLPFARVVKECIATQSAYGLSTYEQIPAYRIQVEALDALQSACESFLVDLFAMAQLCAEHANRVTIFNRDMVLVLRIRKMFEQ